MHYSSKLFREKHDFEKIGILIHLTTASSMDFRVPEEIFQAEVIAFIHALFFYHIHVLNNPFCHGRRASQKVLARAVAWCMGVLSFTSNNILHSPQRCGLSTRRIGMCHYCGNCSTFDDKELFDTVFALSLHS